MGGGVGRIKSKYIEEKVTRARKKTHETGKIPL